LPRRARAQICLRNGSANIRTIGFDGGESTLTAFDHKMAKGEQKPPLPPFSEGIQNGRGVSYQGKAWELKLAVKHPPTPGKN